MGEGGVGGRTEDAHRVGASEDVHTRVVAWLRIVTDIGAAEPGNPLLEVELVDEVGGAGV